MRFAEVKEEPAQQAGDTQQNVWVPRLMMVIALVFGFAGATHALQVTDDRGVTITLPAAPQRIVSLLPSLAETVCIPPIRPACKSCPRSVVGWTRTSR